MEDKKIESIIEGILFAMGGTVEPSRIAKALEIEEQEVVAAVSRLKEKYETEGRGISITELDGAYQMCTNPDVYEYLIRIAKQPRKYVLTDVLLETLSIIAYKQPVTRAEIENLRGVSPDNMLRILIDRQLVKEVGRRDTPGRPVEFGTTKEFLKFFRLNSIAELPKLDEKEEERFVLAR